MPRVVVFDEPGTPEVLRIVDEPSAAPAKGEVQLEVEAIGLNRLDQMMRAGMSPRPLRFPRARLGIEATGTIRAVGAEVSEHRVGDAVIVTAVPDMDVNGTYAEYVTVPASRVIARPAALEATDAAAVWVAFSTAYGALIEKAKLQPGQHVLITAASSAVGLAAIQIANYIGAIPLAVTRQSAKKSFLLGAGAAAVIATDVDDLHGIARRHTGGKGVDVIFDAVMGEGLAELATAAKFGGTLVAVGWMDPRPPTFPMGALTIHRYMSFEHTLDPVVVHRMAAFLNAALRNGALRPIVDKVFRFDDVVAAHRYLEQARNGGKIVVTL